MRHNRNTSHSAEIHRYFPEWADRPVGRGTPCEADRNSYLAGGYAEEFGYRTPPDRSPAMPVLDDNPERTMLWSVQIGALHPGYPECPTPLERLSIAQRAEGAAVESRPAAGDGVGSFVDSTEIRVIRVARRSVEQGWGLSVMLERLRERRIRRRGLRRWL